ncbi:MAG: hypothetical protein IFK94_15675, partial [Acidobacteria bacterium]|nr:hypothetical protein [Candidatus Polarisedimenticola svalbardensis]
MLPSYLRIAGTFLVLWGFTVFPGMAQSTSGQLAGKLVDATSEPVAGAVVQVRSETTGMVRT